MLFQETISPVPRSAFISDEPGAILRFACEAVDEGVGCALATLVEIRGGAARALGAQMAIRQDGLYCGYVSGGCTEPAIAAEAMAAIDKDRDRFLMLGQGSEFFDIQLPCGGGITIAIHVIRRSKPLREVLAHLQARRRSGMRYDPRTQRLEVCAPANRAKWEGECFLRPYRPQTRIVLCGRSIELEATVRIAEAAGYEVVVLDCTGPRPPSADLFDADSAVAFLHHDVDRELPALRGALASNAFYIGALGSSRTHQRRCEQLDALGFGQDSINRIKAPIGIFAKARDAQSLALSVLADIAAARLNAN
ncbi:XdhC family protein [Sinorhizobium fredii]|uniref:XdhC family protein n=1 Tax=Rhizobium fredii TaxID=380 RepID=UPI00210E466F|nr:XdhC family protein [Sinorhizobium fredii]UTY47904.1 XdhC family protein [Sinorhizobium fredii]